MIERDGLDPRSLPGPETVAEALLPNGLRVLVRENHASPAVVVEGLLFGGGLLDPVDQPGLAGFATALLDRGTARHSFAELSDMIESVGAEIGFGAGRHTVGFDAKCLVEDLPRVLHLMADMLATPTFPDDQVAQVRGQIVTALQQRQASTRYRAIQAFRAVAYGPDHPYGRIADGTPEGVMAMTRDDLVHFYRTSFHPAGGIVVIVGAVETSAALDVLAVTLGSWQPGGTPPPRPVVDAPPPSEQRRQVFVTLPGKTQADVVLGNPAIARAHPDWLPAALANSVLGVFGLMGRLGKNVRDTRGLAYHVSSSLGGGLGPGAWTASAGVSPANIVAATEAILTEMRRLRDEPVPDDELTDVKAFITGCLPLRLETNEGVAGTLLDIVLYDLGLDYLQRFAGLIGQLSAADVQAAARRHLHPDTAAIAVAGPPAVM